MKLKHIVINYEVIELLDFFWNTVARREKASDIFIMEIANRPEMQAIYGEGFDAESVRKCLSAVNNYEAINNPTAEEQVFFNYNKFNADDPGNVSMTLPKVKTLNVDEAKALVGEASQYETIKVNFVPAYDMIYRIDGDTISLNYFKIVTDWADLDKVVVDNVSMKDYVIQLVQTAATTA